MKYLTGDDTTKLKGWISFYPTFGNGLYLEKAAYFDERPTIVGTITSILSLIGLLILPFYSLWWLFLVVFLFVGWGRVFIHLPIKTGIQDCDSAAWGFNYHGNKIWLYIGGSGNYEGGRKWKTFTMPWDPTWIRRSTLIKGNPNYWHHETKKNPKEWNGVNVGSYEWLKIYRYKETHPYIDSYDGTTVNATLSMVETEWRPLWFQWTSLFAKKSTFIDIEFDQEVGKQKGEWKGGCIGCSYEIKTGETMLQCLKRMEKERKF